MFNINTLSALEKASNTPKVPMKAVNATLEPKPIEGLLLPYQLDWLLDKASVMMAVKGRRTGLTWSDSLKSVLDAIKGVNTYYSSYNQDTTANYIKYCKKWARALNTLVQLKTHTQIIDEREVLVYKLKFVSGGQIVALAGNATNLRDKEGNLVLDEAAFRDDLATIIDAAMAILIWGGQVRFISTLNGTDNHFTHLWNEVKEGKKDYSLHFLPFRKAVSQGLFKKICLRKGETHSKDKEEDWIKEIYDLYGLGATQELDCVPSEDGGNGLFETSWFQYRSDWEAILCIRAWDIAATEADGCYSVGVKMALTEDYKIVIIDAVWGQFDPTTGDDLIRELAKSDGADCLTIIEQEPGSESIRWKTYLEESMNGYLIDFKRPIGKKLSRAIPLANGVRRGDVFIGGTGGTLAQIPELCAKFGNKKKELVSDLVDTLSLGHAHLAQYLDSTMLGT